MSSTGVLRAARAVVGPRRLMWLRPVALALVALLAVGAWRLGPYAQRGFTEYRLPDRADLPAAIAAGPDGTVWFTLETSPFIGTVRDGQVRKLLKGKESVEPLGLAVDASGAAWYTDQTERSISRITADGRLTTHRLDTPVARLGRLVVAPDGALWFAEITADSITRLKDGTFTRFRLRAPDMAPFGVTVDGQGTVWATLGEANSLVRITPDGRLSEVEAPSPRAGLSDLAAGPDGSIWAVELRVNRLARYRDGRFNEYAIPSPNAGVTSLVVAPNGDVWFTELVHHRIGRLRDGHVTEFRIPRDDARPYGLAIDRGGNVWYADLKGRVGMLSAQFARSSCAGAEPLLAGLNLCWPGV